MINIQGSSRKIILRSQDLTPVSPSSAVTATLCFCKRSMRPGPSNGGLTVEKDVCDFASACGFESGSTAFLNRPRMVSPLTVMRLTFPYSSWLLNSV